MFFSLNDLRLNKQKHIKSNFKSILTLSVFFLLEILYVTVACGFERSLILFHLFYLLLQIRPVVVQKSLPISIKLFENRRSNRLFLNWCIFAIVFIKFARFIGKFSYFAASNLKYAQIDNVNLNKLVVELAILTLLELTSRADVSIGFHQLKKTNVQIMSVIQYAIFSMFLIILFAFIGPDMCLTYNDLGTYYLLNLFAFNKILLELFQDNQKVRKWLVLTIEWGFAVLTFLHLTLDYFWISKFSFYRNPIIFFFFTRGYFILMDVLKFHEDIPEFGFIEQFQTGIERYCLENNKIDSAQLDRATALNQLKVVVELRRFLNALEGSEDIDHYVLKFDKLLVQPALEMISQHRNAFGLGIEILVNLAIVAFVPIKLELDIILTWIYFITSISFKKKRRTFRIVLISLYVMMMFFYSMDTFFRMRYSSLAIKTQDRHFQTGTYYIPSNQYVMMQYLMITLFILVQINFYRKSPIKKQTEVEVQKKITEILGKGTVGIHVWSFLWKIGIYILNVVLFYFSIKTMLTELNLLNLLFLALLFRAIFRNSEDFVQIGRIVVIYQSIRVFMV
jgi:hypothetical protein